MASKLPMAETVGMALSTLRSNRLRSLLTMLGIVIGNASVITLVGVGRGAPEPGRRPAQQPGGQRAVCGAGQQ
jgi:hypothetical protein